MKATAEDVCRILVCPRCRAPLRPEGNALTCREHGSFATTNEGYLNFTLEQSLQAVESTSEAYAEDQRTGKERFFQEFLRPYLYSEPFQRVLEVGSGLGMEISFLLAEGRDAYGVDLPCLSPFWARLGNDPNHFLHCDGAAMPFPDGYFVVGVSLGVIEHIGTQVGHYTLCDDYDQKRQAFAKELLRVTKPNGRLLLTCPNKSFPVDLAHEPADAATPEGAGLIRWAGTIRRFIYQKTGMTLHIPWGKYHLLSYPEMRRLFCAQGTHAIEPVSLQGYFAFKRFGSGPFGMFKRIVSAYVEHLPRFLRATPLNPFVAVQVRK